MPFWSQISTKVASAGLSQRLAVGDRRGAGDALEEQEEEQEEEKEEEKEGEEDGFGRMLSQLSAR